MAKDGTTAIAMLNDYSHPESVADYLRRISPPPAYMECGSDVVADQKRFMLRWVGQQSFSRYVGKMLGGPGDSVDRVWEHLARDDNVRELRKGLIYIARRSWRKEQVPPERVQRLGDWVAGKTPLLDPSAHGWALLRAVAQELYRLGTSSSGMMTADELKRRLPSCWAWDAWCMEEPCGEAWIVVEVLGIMVRMCEDDGLLEDSKAEVSMISLEAYGNDPSGGIFRSLHPCMHWMLDWELKKLIRTPAEEGTPVEDGLACPLCRTPIQFARKLKWIQVATEAPARRQRAAVRIQARVRMRQARKRVRATKGLEQVPEAYSQPLQETGQVPL